jgi:hypothetical protein
VRRLESFDGEGQKARFFEEKGLGVKGHKICHRAGWRAAAVSRMAQIESDGLACLARLPKVAETLSCPNS